MLCAKTDIQKAHTFANYFSKVFVPSPLIPSDDILQEVNQVLTETVDSNTPIKSISKNETKSIINSLNTRKRSRYDLITATLLKNLPEKGFTIITYLYNAIFPPQWKVAE